MSEIKYFQDDEVKVTNVRLELKSKTYLLADILWIAIGNKAPDRRLGAGLLLLGLAAALVAFLILSRGDPTGVVPLMIGFVLVIAGVASLGSARPRYALSLGTGGGQVEALVSENKEYISKILDAAKAASAKRG
jgi:hypothetical protein